METGTATTALDYDGDERFQRLRAELGVTSFGMNLIRLRPGQVGRIHAHDTQEEVYLVLEGTLTLATGEDDSQPLRAGQLARVAPDVRRQLRNESGDPLYVLALGGATEHVGRDGRAWESWDEPGEGRSPQDIPLPADVEPR
jgi:uncharacterized cupin superfamily protein